MVIDCPTCPKGLAGGDGEEIARCRFTHARWELEDSSRWYKFRLAGLPNENSSYSVTFALIFLLTLNRYLLFN